MFTPNGQLFVDNKTGIVKFKIDKMPFTGYTLRDALNLYRNYIHLPELSGNKISGKVYLQTLAALPQPPLTPHPPSTPHTPLTPQPPLTPRQSSRPGQGSTLAQPPPGSSTRRAIATLRSQLNAGTAAQRARTATQRARTASMPTRLPGQVGKPNSRFTLSNQFLLTKQPDATVGSTLSQRPSPPIPATRRRTPAPPNKSGSQTLVGTRGKDTVPQFPSFTPPTIFTAPSRTRTIKGTMPKRLPSGPSGTVSQEGYANIYKKQKTMSKTMPHYMNPTLSSRAKTARNRNSSIYKTRKLNR